MQEQPLPAVHAASKFGIYARAFCVVAIACLTALGVALADDKITSQEWVGIAVAGLVAYRAWLDQSKSTYDSLNDPNPKPALAVDGTADTAKETAP